MFEEKGAEVIGTYFKICFKWDMLLKIITGKSVTVFKL